MSERPEVDAGEPSSRPRDPRLRFPDPRRISSPDTATTPSWAPAPQQHQLPPISTSRVMQITGADRISSSDATISPASAPTQQQQQGEHQMSLIPASAVTKQTSADRISSPDGTMSPVPAPVQQKQQQHAPPITSITGTQRTSVNKFYVHIIELIKASAVTANWQVEKERIQKRQKENESLLNRALRNKTFPSLAAAVKQSKSDDDVDLARIDDKINTHLSLCQQLQQNIEDYVKFNLSGGLCAESATFHIKVSNLEDKVVQLETQLKEAQSVAERANAATLIAERANADSKIQMQRMQMDANFLRGTVNELQMRLENCSENDRKQKEQLLERSAQDNAADSRIQMQHIEEAINVLRGTVDELQTRLENYSENHRKLKEQLLERSAQDNAADSRIQMQNVEEAINVLRGTVNELQARLANYSENDRKQMVQLVTRSAQDIAADSRTQNHKMQEAINVLRGTINELQMRLENCSEKDRKQIDQLMKKSTQDNTAISAHRKRLDDMKLQLDRIEDSAVSKNHLNEIVQAIKKEMKAQTEGFADVAKRAFDPHKQFMDQCAESIGSLRMKFKEFEDRISKLENRTVTNLKQSQSNGSRPPDIERRLINLESIFKFSSASNLQELINMKEMSDDFQLAEIEILQEKVRRREEELENLKAELANFSNEIANLRKNDAALTEKVASISADLPIKDRLDVVEIGLHSLENRYNNLSTEPIVKSMVLALQEIYPTPSAMTEKLRVVTDELATLKGRMDGVHTVVTQQLNARAQEVTIRLREAMDKLAALKEQVDALETHHVDAVQQGDRPANNADKELEDKVQRIADTQNKFIDNVSHDYEIAKAEIKGLEKILSDEISRVEAAQQVSMSSIRTDLEKVQHALLPAKQSSGARMPKDFAEEMAVLKRDLEKIRKSLQDAWDKVNPLWARSNSDRQGQRRLEECVTQYSERVSNLEQQLKSQNRDADETSWDRLHGEVRVLDEKYRGFEQAMSRLARSVQTTSDDIKTINGKLNDVTGPADQTLEELGMTVLERQGRISRDMFPPLEPESIDDGSRDSGVSDNDVTSGRANSRTASIRRNKRRLVRDEPELPHSSPSPPYPPPLESRITTSKRPRLNSRNGLY